ncbi:MAG: MFS transporter [Ignavibacteria bacterium]|nr:MFS transporter [Ignavibacteria bacterium]
MKLPEVFRSLSNKVFAQLYFAQSVSLFGDAITWLGLALLAFELSPSNSAEILSIALTLRVAAFVFVAPYAGVLADRFDRKYILATTHFVRLAIVCMFPFVTEVWQLYVLMFGLNVFNAFFTPTYNATVPLVFSDEIMYGRAISLSASTYQLLGVLGPGIAGSLAAFIGLRQIFFIDAATFFIAAIVIVALPGPLLASPDSKSKKQSNWSDIKTGTRLLFGETQLRFPLFMQLGASVAGALILVGTVGYVQGSLHLQVAQYGWVMSALGIGATMAAFWLGSLRHGTNLVPIIIAGATLVSLVIIPANLFTLPILMVAWFVAGAAQSLVNVSMQTLIALHIPKPIQGRVYGAHFAWSHLWWAFSYPLAGAIQRWYPDSYFFVGGMVALVVLTLVFTLAKLSHARLKGD